MHPNPSAFSLQRRVRGHARNHDAYAWFNVLTSPEMFDQVESLLPWHRERLFPPTETLSMFLVFSGSGLDMTASITAKRGAPCPHHYVKT